MIEFSGGSGYRVIYSPIPPEAYNVPTTPQEVKLYESGSVDGQQRVDLVTDPVITEMDGVEYVIPEGYTSYGEYIADFGKRNCMLPEPPVPEYDMDGDGGSCIGGHDWLMISTDDILAGNSQFLKRAFDMFRKPTDDPSQYYKKYAEFSMQTGVAYKELQQQIADGKGDSLFTLETKFSLGGMELTVGDLIHLHEGLNQTMGFVKSFGDFEDMAFIGMSVSKFKQYAKDTFSPDLTDQMISFYEDRLQEAFYNSGFMHVDYEALGFQPNFNEPYDLLPCDFNMSNPRSFNALTYHKFANLDLKDESAYQDAVTWYLQGIKRWSQISGCNYNENHHKTALNYYRSFYV